LWRGGWRGVNRRIACPAVSLLPPARSRYDVLFLILYFFKNPPKITAKTKKGKSTSGPASHLPHPNNKQTLIYQPKRQPWRKETTFVSFPLLVET
jgi:hypothetical protein